MPDVAGSHLQLGRYLDAVALALKVHGGQVRKGTQIPYMAHVMSVSALVLENGGDSDTAIAGLLHDTIEDAPDGRLVKDRIERDFGERVVQIVMGCSDVVAASGSKTPDWKQRKNSYLSKLRSEENTDVRLVSACDKLHNARAIVGDLRAIGDELWDRFTAPKSDQLWYYGELANAYPVGSIPPRLRDELRRVISELQALA